MDIDDANEQDPADNNRIETISTACNSIEKDNDDGNRSFGLHNIEYRKNHIY